MKKHIALLISTLIISPLQAESLSLSITNFEKAEGQLLVSIFDSKHSYDSSKRPVIALRRLVTQKSLSFTFPDIKTGEYAIKVFHDANNNGKLDTNLVGIPKESYGFSNNAGNMGPASYKDAKFTVPLSDQKHIEIKLR